MAYTTFKPIVTDGMVLNLDAANRRSFVSGSTSWYDLSGRGNTGTLNNMGSTGYTSSNGGTLESRLLDIFSIQFSYHFYRVILPVANSYGKA